METTQNEMKRTYDFILGEIANDFRFHFTNKLSNKALENSWRSSTKMQTNETQDALFFSQEIRYDTGRVVEAVYRDIQDVFKNMRDMEYTFDVKCINKAKKYEITNIKWS